MVFAPISTFDLPNYDLKLFSVVFTPTRYARCASHLSSQQRNHPKELCKVMPGALLQ
jgi:hypothetical protein